METTIVNHAADSLGKAPANDAQPTEAAPTPSVLLAYPEWSTVIDSLLDAFARLDAARRPTPSASPITPADGRPPHPTTLTDEQAFLASLACLERPDVSRMIDSLNGLLEAAMTLHLRAVLRHNHQVRQGGLSQSSEGGNV